MKNKTLKFEIESLTVADFRRFRLSEQLNLQPEYQRKAIWPMPAKVSLMETILLGYPIPEIYLAYETTADGDQSISVVDGQQRLTALLEFIENSYRLDGLENSTGVSQYEGYFFRDLPDEVRTEFFQYRFPVRRLSNLNDDFVREVFARVNRVNMTLTQQEIRNALLPGPFYDFLKDCVSHELVETSGVFSVARSKRGGDLEFFAEVFGTCLFGVTDKKAELDERYDKLTSEFDEYQGDAKQFLSVLTLVKDVVKWQGQVRWSNIIDMFTILNVFWDDFPRLIESDQNMRLKIGEVLDLFQNAVTLNKRANRSDSWEREVICRLIEMSGQSEKEIIGLIDTYTSGIRNSSDLGSRRRRLFALEQLVSSLD